MKWQELSDDPCPIARTLGVIGDRWTLLILRNAFMRTRRFDDFHKQLGITKHVLSDRLQSLVEMGVMNKVKYQERPDRFEYRLTPRGKDLYPVLLSMVAWGSEHTSSESAIDIEYLHTTCGQITQPKFTCSHCSEEVNTSNIIPKPKSSLRIRPAQKN